MGKETDNIKRASPDFSDAPNRIYKTVIDATPDLVYVFDLQYRFTYANYALLTMWGKSWGDAIGKGLRENGYEEWHALMHEREIDQIAATKKSVRGEVGFPHATLGRRVYDYILVPVFNDQGNVEAVAGTTRDISNIRDAERLLKEKESELANAIELAELGTWKFSAGKMSVSENSTHIFGLREAEITIDGFFALVAIADRARITKIFDDAMIPQSNGRVDVEFGIINGTTGTGRVIHILGQSYFDSPGVFVKMEGTAQDVTVQREAQLALENEVQIRTEQLQIMNEELQATNEELSTSNEELSDSTELLIRSNEQLSQFAHIASHDLQEPVRKISVFVELLNNSLKDLDPQSKSYLAKIDQSANRMLNLIRDVLAHSQISNMASKFETVDLNKVLANTLNDLEVLIQKGNCSIVSEVLPVVSGIEVQLGQMFSNLISNAMKFAKPGTPLKLEIQSRLLGDNEKLQLQSYSTNKSYYSIAFKDNGIGFDQLYASKIFEIFQRLHNKYEYAGTGIGLATCKKIVLNHGGEISATSSEGQGATFFIVLPATHN